MEKYSGPNSEIVQRFCPARNENIPMEITTLDSGSRSLKCLGEEQCRLDRGNCQNCLRDYW